MPPILFTIGLQIDWPNVASQEAFYVGMLFGGVPVFFACYFLHCYLMARREARHETETNHRLTAAYHEGELAGAIKAKRESWHTLTSIPWQNAAPIHAVASEQAANRMSEQTGN
jgi:hypothetical protein